MLILVENTLLNIRPQQIITSEIKLENQYLIDITPKLKSDGTSKKTNGSKLRSKPE